MKWVKSPDIPRHAVACCDCVAKSHYSSRNMIGRWKCSRPCEKKDIKVKHCFRYGIASSRYDEITSFTPASLPTYNSMLDVIDANNRPWWDRAKVTAKQKIGRFDTAHSLCSILSAIEYNK